TLISGTIPGTAEVWASSNNITQKISISFTESGITPPVFLTLGSSVNTVKTDDSNSADITAVVLDVDRAPIKGVTVFFSTASEDGTAGAGQISESSLVTDENGEAVIQFSSGLGDKRNQIVTIIATVDGVGSKQIPIKVSGTVIFLTAGGETSMEVGNSSQLRIEVKDAGNAPVYDVPVSLSLSPESTGMVSIETVNGKTDFNGELLATVTGTGDGTAIIQVESLGAIAEQTYTIDDPNRAFRIIAPDSDVVSLPIDGNLTVTVLSSSYDTVTFATTIGTWDGTSSKMVVKTTTNGEASAIFSAADAGTATIQVFPNDDVTISDSMKVAISAPSSDASKISFQAFTTVVAPSTQDVKNSVTLTAKVTNDGDQIVGGAPVLFSIDNPTGGGEFVTPAIGFTNDSGIVTSVFTSGSLVAGADGVRVSATLISNAASDTVSIVISGQAASLVIGRSTEIESINNDTAYRLPMSILVTDANGSPVDQATVSLNLWPSEYVAGAWVEIIEWRGDLTPYTVCKPDWEVPDQILYIPEDFRPNEDVNKNLVLDPGEDINLDGKLTPTLSAAGAVPDILVTDENGVVNFYLTYMKSSAAWIL
ncbi:Ig-like domain-containing protein, partial [bacterium]|nr:Ig-like domain-containing protein [bacterium]